MKLRKENKLHFSDYDGKNHGLIAETKNFVQTTIDFRRFLHLIPHVNLPELLEKAQQSQLEFFTALLQ